MYHFQLKRNLIYQNKLFILLLLLYKFLDQVICKELN